MVITSKLSLPRHSLHKGYKLKEVDLVARHEISSFHTIALLVAHMPLVFDPIVRCVCRKILRVSIGIERSPLISLIRPNPRYCDALMSYLRVWVVRACLPNGSHPYLPPLRQIET